MIRAEGRAFSVGGDLRELAAHSDRARPEALRTLVASYNRAILALSKLELPIVAAVHGSVAGGALGLICAADIVVAAHDTIFTCAYSKLGLTAEGGVSWFLPRLVGLRKAQELLLLSPQFSADEAVAWGLVTRACPYPELESVSRGMAQALAGQPRSASAAQRTLLRDASSRSLNAQFDAETESMWQAASERGFAEGIHEFFGSKSSPQEQAARHHDAWRSVTGTPPRPGASRPSARDAFARSSSTRTP